MSEQGTHDPLEEIRSELRLITEHLAAIDASLAVLVPQTRLLTDLRAIGRATLESVLNIQHGIK